MRKLIFAMLLAACAKGGAETDASSSGTDAHASSDARPIDAVPIDADTRPLVTVDLVGTGSGTVTGTPALTCSGTTCTARVDPGTPVMLTQTVSGSSQFAGWIGGSCTGTGTCSFTADADITIEAPFVALNQTLAYTGAVQTFTVPQGIDVMVIEAVGAQGGGSVGGGGGLGASMIGTYAVTPGETLNVVVGQMGLLQVGGQDQNSSGGGGGTFVYDTSNTLWVAAGGGGGRCNYASALALCNGANGQITPDGSTSCPGGGTSAVDGIGGTGGNGGGGGAWSTTPASGGGAGWLSAGTTSPYGGLNASAGWAGGQGFCNGGGGGCGGVGGFGGGGGGGNFYGGGGGGGGYSGGGGGSDPTHGGGGGSFSSGTNQRNTAGVGAGNGVVKMYW